MYSTYNYVCNKMQTLTNSLVGFTGFTVNELFVNLHGKFRNPLNNFYEILFLCTYSNINVFRKLHRYFFILFARIMRNLVYYLIFRYAKRLHPDCIKIKTICLSCLCYQIKFYNCRL